VGTFMARTDILLQNPGGGKLVGHIVIDQVYARYQHERAYLKHPHGGGSKFLTRALVDEGPRGLQSLATATLRGDQNIVMSRVTERIVARAVRLEPKDMGDLAKSATVTTIDRGRIVYRRRGEGRLTDKQIEAKRRRRGRK
jgi:hypothetical protein